MRVRGILVVWGVLGSLLLAHAAAAQTKVEALPDPVQIPFTEVAYVHPLWKPLDAPPRLLETPKATDLEARVTLFLTVRVEPSGMVPEAIGVEPPLKGLTAPLPTLVPKWRFTPAKKEGRPVATWATLALDLDISVEKPVFTIFRLVPLEKQQPLETPAVEVTGDAWLKRFPKQVSPSDGNLSVEDVDFLPTVDKVKWSYDSTRLRSRLQALVLVSAAGTVKKIVPVAGPGYEPFIYSWLRTMAPRWKVAPGTASGQPVDSWMTLEGSVEYTVDTAKERGKRTIQKNLRATSVE